MHEGGARARVEEEPVLLDGGARRGRVARELGEVRVGLQRAEREAARGGGDEPGEGRVQGAQVHEPEAVAGVAGSGARLCSAG